MALRLAAADRHRADGVRRRAGPGRRAGEGRRLGGGQRRRPGRPGRRHLRDGARRRPGARRARRDPRRGAATARPWSSTRPSPPTPRGQLADTAGRHGVKVLDAPVSGGAMGAADGTLAIMVGGSDEAFAAARPALDVMGSLVTHAGPIGVRHEVQAGPQPDALRGLHRRDRGAAPGRGRRSRPGRARQGRPPHRRDHRRTGRDHAPRHDRADRPRTTSGTASSPTSARWGRRT